MTPEEIARSVVSQKYGQLMLELVSALTDLAVAQQRIKALEEAAKPKPENVVTIKKEGANETPLRAD